MATRPTVIASQKPREIRLDQAGRRASVPIGDEPKGDVRQVGTSNTAVPEHKHAEAGPMVVRPATKLKVVAPPPELLAAMAKAKEEPAKVADVVQRALSTRGLDFSARLQQLKEQNTVLKRQMMSLERKPGAAKAATPKAQSRIKAVLARRKVT